MRKMNIILIGPVSKDIERAKFLFTSVERACVEEGHVVVQNPMRDHIAGKSEAEYMQESLSRICQLVIDNKPNLIAIILPHWDHSEGALCEIDLCRKLHITRHYWNIFPNLPNFAIAPDDNKRAPQ
jgi:hypothetical protein